MSVGRICMRDVDAASCDESALVAARRMRDRNVGTLVVVNDRNEPMGLLSDRDLALRVIAQAEEFSMVGALLERESPHRTT